MNRPVANARELALDVPDGSAPLFSRIAQAIADDIARGRLRPGQRLPGTRRLAEILAVHRNTAVAAYRELVAQGWAQARPASGTVVSDTIPQRTRSATRPKTRPLRPAFSLRAIPRTRPPRPEDVEFDLGGGLPDPRLTPGTELARAMGRVLRRRATPQLHYGDPRGHPGLRREIAAMLAQTRGLAIGPDELVITRGSQMALYLLGAALLERGDTVAVESLGYEPAWSAFAAHGGQIRAVPLDEHGLAVDALFKSPPPRAVYVTPHHQYPTTVPLSADRRVALLAWAAKHRVAIIEDDYDNEYHYDGRPLLPLAAADRHGSVATVGTLSKVVAPGLRIGWIAAPTAVVERIAKLRAVVDGQGSLPTEAAVAELLEDGELQRHIWRTKRAYHRRRDALVDALKRQLPDTLSFEVPAGGMALWTTVDPSVDVQAWADAARAKGVAVTVGRQYAVDRRARPNLRLGFARHTETELSRAVKRLASCRR